MGDLDEQQTSTTGDFLRIGDMVSFYCEDAQGYLYADNPVTGRCIVPPSPPEHPYTLPNVNGSVFTVLARNKYKMNKKYQALLKTKATSKMTDSELGLPQAEKNARGETDDNALEQKRSRGKIVVYGQIVQLQHRMTDQFLYVSSSVAAELDVTDMSVRLVNTNSKNCYFRVMPRFKVRSEGDPIRKGDQIVLESVKTNGQYLRVNVMQRFPDEDLERGKFEVCLSVTKTTFVLTSFSSYTDQESNFIKGGDTICLLHKEFDAYVAAEGIFSGTGFSEGVHLRTRRATGLDQALTTNNPVAYWQIEADGEAMKGEHMRWEQLIRIRHMTTRKYLTVVKEGAKVRLALSDDARDVNGVFRITPVIKEKDLEIEYESYGRIHHPMTKTWLHGMGDPYTLEQYKDMPQEGMSSLKWDKNTLHSIRPSTKLFYDDAFAIVRIAEDSIAKFNYVMGIIPVLERHIAMWSGKELSFMSVEDYHTIMTHLEQLRQFLFVDGTPMKDRQKLIRICRLVEMSIRLVQMASKPPKNFVSQVPTYFNDKGIDMEDLSKFPKHKNVAISVYKLLAVYLQGSSRKNELYIAKYIPYFQTQIGYKLGVADTLMQLVENNRPVLDRIDAATIGIYIMWLKKQKQANYLKFLKVLCVCDGKSLPQNQTTVAEGLFEADAAGKLLYQTRVGPDGTQVKVGSDWVPLEEFCKKKEDSEFFTHQLGLFANLCINRHLANIERISKKFVSYKEAFNGMCNAALPPNIRSAYTDLIRVLYVDVGDNIPVTSRVRLTYAWDKLEENPGADEAEDATVSLSGSVMLFFPELRDFILQFVKENRVLICGDSNRDHNNFIEHVLTLARFCVLFGYYDDEEDIANLMSALLLFLDGTTDAKEKDQDEAIRAEWLKKDRLKKNPGNKAVVNAKYAGLEIVDSFFNLRLSKRLQRILFDFKRLRLHAGKQQAEKSRFVSLNFGAILPSGIPSEVLALSPCLTIGVTNKGALIANEYIDMIRNQSDYLDPDKNMVHVLLDLARYDYTKMPSLATRILSRNFTQNENLLEKGMETRIICHPDSISIFDKIIEKQVALRRLISLKQNAEQEKEIMGILQYFIDICTLPDDKSEPHPANQQMLMNASVLDDVFEILTKEVDVKLPEMYAGLIKIFGMAFELLGFLCLKNAKAQKRVYDQLDFLMKVPVALKEMANMIFRVLNNNRELCVKLKEKNIKAMVDLLADTHLPEFLQVLAAIVKVGVDYTVKRNQNLVIKFIMQRRKDVLLKVGDEENEERIRMLETASGMTHDQQLRYEDIQYHWRLVRLLSTCSEGENRFIESMCQNIFSIQEILEVLNHAGISLSYKRPYMRFLLWAYLSTAGSVVESGTSEIHLEEGIWKFIDNMIDETNRILKLDLDSMFDHPDIEGINVFLWEASVPFFNVFIDKYYNADDDHLSRVIPGHKKTMTAVADACLALFEKLKTCTNYADKHYFRNLTSLLMVMDKKNILNEKQQEVYANIVDNQLSGGKKPKMVKQTVKKFLEEYKEEFTLNDAKLKFLKNLRKMYVEDPSLPDYPEEHMINGNIPRGVEFQNYLQTFVKYERNTFHDGVVQTEEVKTIVHALNISLASAGEATDSKRFEQNDLDCKHLRLLRAIITNERLTLEGLEDPEEIDARWEKIKEIQNAVNDCGAGLISIKFMSSKDELVVRTSMRLFCSLLDGGNEKVQKTFEDYVLKSREEEFFNDTKNRLQSSLVAVKEQRSALSQMQRDKERRETLLRGTIAKGSLQHSDRNRSLQDNKSIEMKPLGQGSTMNIQTLSQLNQEAKFDDDDDEEQESLKFSKVVGFTELLLRILQLLCEGHNTPLQDYLRFQPDNMTSVNLVKETIGFFLVIYPIVEPDSLSILAQTMNSINEYATGNVGNQKDLFDNKVLDPLNHLLRLKQAKDVSEEDLGELKATAITLINTMLESNSAESKALAREMVHSLDVNEIYENMKYYFDMYKQRKSRGRVKGVSSALSFSSHDSNDDGFDPMKICIQCYVVINRLKDLASDMPETEIRSDEEYEEVLRALHKLVVSIEILRDDELEKVYFPASHKKFLQERRREDVKWSVDRSSPSDKIRDFMEQDEDLREDMKYQQKIMSNRLWKFVLDHSKIWNNVVLLLTFLLNGFMLGYWRGDADLQSPIPVFDDNTFFVLLYVFGALHIIVSAIVLLDYLLSSPIRSWQDAILRPMNYYYIAFFGFSVLGIIFYGYSYGFHLLHIVIGNQLLVRVLQSVTKNGKALLWVAALGVVVIYIFSLICFAAYRASFDYTNFLFCENLWQCFITNLNWGLTNGGSLNPYDFSWGLVGGQAFYDLAFFIIVSTIGMNIIFGIIVDTFSELRDEKFQAEEDMRNSCFICSLRAYDFDRSGGGFKHHITEDHNMWNYLFFIVYLDHKDKNDLTAHEAFVWDMVRDKDNSWFPVSRALALQREENELRDDLIEIKTNLRSLLDRFAEEDRRKAEEDQRRLANEWQERTRGADS